ncbi:hypothetical protein N7522_006241 [Penicillium canescens]|nr:hypothetical protein N7522_006241 [Penicillium canescens]
MAGLNTYLVLDDPLPSDSIPFTLGVLVLEPQRPLDLKWPYMPEDSFLRTTQENKLEPVNQKDAHFMLNKDCDASLKLALQHVFSIVAKRANTTELELNTAKVSTYRLTNHYVVFDRLITDFAREIVQFIKKNGRGRKLYMIVGFKTIVDQRIRVYHKSLAEKKGKATIPVAEVIQAASGAPPTIHAGNPSAEVATSNSREVLLEATGDGESIFAIQYRRIKRRPLLKRLLDSIRQHQSPNLVLSDIEDRKRGAAMGREGGMEQGREPFGGFEDIECEISDSEQDSSDDDDELRIGGLPTTEQHKYLLKKDGAGNDFYLHAL